MLSTDEARALITTSLDDQALADAIAREEAWLARRIGPLEGSRTETFITDTGAEVLLLARPTSAVMVDDESGARSVDLLPWSDVRLIDGAWSGSITATYTPDDELEVKRALITLVRLSVSESAFASEAASGYSATVDPAAQRMQRWSAWRGLLRPSLPRSVRIRGAGGVDRLHAVSVTVDAS